MPQLTRCLRRMGGPLVAAADGREPSAPPAAVPAGGDGGGVMRSPAPTLPRRGERGEWRSEPDARSPLAMPGPPLSRERRRGFGSGVVDDRTGDLHRRDQRLFLPGVAEGQRTEARLSRRLWRVAALDPVPRRAGRASAPSSCRHCPAFPAASAATPCSTAISTGCWRCASCCSKAGLDGADLAGSSVGGSFAAEIAAIWPGSVRRLALIAPFGLFDEKDPATDPWAQRAARRARPAVRRSGALGGS